MSSFKKILLLITNLGQGGAQRVFHDHSVFLSEYYNVDEAVFDKEEAENLFDSGNKLFSLDVKGNGSILTRILNFFRRCRRLNKLIQKEQSHICISHMDGANWVNVLSLSPAKKILVVHGTILHDRNQSKGMQWLRTKLIIPFLYNRAEVTVAVSEGIKHELQHTCGVQNVVAIPNYFDLEKIEELASAALPPQWQSLFINQDILITSGRFNEQKKQRYLFPLLRKLKNKNRKVKLVLLGDGELRSALFEEAVRLQLSCYCAWDASQPFSEDYDVYFAGYANNPFQFLRHSKLFLFPSGWEGFPMALCEAMISGVPVLTADCPTGPRQILAPGTFDSEYTLQKAEQTSCGWLMPMTNKNSFTAEWIQVIERMLEDSNLRNEMTRSARRRMDQYSKEKVISQWKELIDSLLL